MENLDEILQQLYNNNISVNDAKQAIVGYFNPDKLKIEWLINDTYIVVDDDGTTIHQGSIKDCNNFLSGYYYEE